jgi:RimJ/RimL family protein N-acetyltransferase
MCIEQSSGGQGDRIRLRRTTESDLDAILQLEQDEENRAYIIPWTYEQHRAACSNPDLAHWVIETRHDSAMLGFLLLAGRENAHRSIEFRRIVIADKGKGSGKEVLKLVKQVVFEQWKAHRLWLDVFAYNLRARHVYAAEGFMEEGVLRECVARGEHFESLVIMSLLAQEYVLSQNLAHTSEPGHYT